MIPQFRLCVMPATRYRNLSATIHRNWSNTIGSVKNAIEIVSSVDNLTNRNRKTKMLHNTSGLETRGAEF